MSWMRQQQGKGKHPFVVARVCSDSQLTCLSGSDADTFKRPPPSSDDNDSGIVDVSKRVGFMKVSARPPTVLLGGELPPSTRTAKRAAAARARRLPERAPPKALGSPEMQHKFSLAGKAARLRRSISLTDKLRAVEQADRSSGAHAARMGTSVIDAFVSRDYDHRRWQQRQQRQRQRGGGGAAVAAATTTTATTTTTTAAAAAATAAAAWVPVDLARQAHSERGALATLRMLAAQPPSAAEAALMRSQGILRALERRRDHQIAQGRSDTTLAIDIASCQDQIAQLRRQLANADSDDDDDDGNDFSMRIPLPDIQSLAPPSAPGTAGTSSSIATTASSTSNADAFISLQRYHFPGPLRRKQPVVAAAAAPAKAGACARTLPQNSEFSVPPATQVPGHLYTDRLDSSAGSGNRRGGTATPLRSILRSPSTAGSMVSTASSGARRVSWSPMNCQRQQPALPAARHPSGLSADSLGETTSRPRSSLLMVPSSAGTEAASEAAAVAAEAEAQRLALQTPNQLTYARLPSTAELSRHLMSRRTEFRTIVSGCKTGPELKQQRARRRLSNAAAAMRTIARFQLAAARTAKRAEKAAANKGPPPPSITLLRRTSIMQQRAAD